MVGNWINYQVSIVITVGNLDLEILKIQILPSIMKFYGYVNFGYLCNILRCPSNKYTGSDL